MGYIRLVSLAQTAYEICALLEERERCHVLLEYLGMIGAVLFASSDKDILYPLDMAETAVQVLLYLLSWVIWHGVVSKRFVRAVCRSLCACTLLGRAARCAGVLQV